MAALKDPVKMALVHAMACFDTPSQAVEMVKQEFDITISRQQAAAYDPTKLSGKNMSKKLVAVFYATREAFLKDVSTIPIAQQAYRLRVLQRALAKVEKSGNTAMVSQILEQAAKESGGVFTNKTKLEHSGSVATPELKLVLHGTATTP